MFNDVDKTIKPFDGTKKRRAVEEISLKSNNLDINE